MTEEQQWLVCFDTDRIKSYLFATNRLKEIRGGSVLIAELDKKRKEFLENQYGEGNVVYSAGGGAAVLVPSRQAAESLIAEIEREFSVDTFTATITGIALPPETRIEGQDFGKWMKLAGEHLRHAKSGKASFLTLPIEPYMRLCGSCGQYPAAKEYANNDGSDDWLCQACFKKRGLGGSARYGFFDQFVERTHSEIWKRVKMSDDLDGIGELFSPPGYVGFIALDGNHIGELLEKPATLTAYQAFSSRLYELTENQTFKALAKYGEPHQGIAPFEIVLIGGDDVLLITAADIAIKIALAIATGFEQNSADAVLKPASLERERKKLTMAGGVVLAHADFPIPAMHRLAESLQKSAKKLCAEQGYTSGAIDFLVVSGSDIDLEEMRHAIPHRRPYTLEEMQRLLDHIRKLKQSNFPTSQLQAMYQALFQGEVNAQLASIATLGKLGQRSDRNHYNYLKRFFSDFGVTFDGQLPPWDADKRSALADLVELYPFVQAQGGQDEQDVY
jgi:hypothetical protein